VVFHGGIDPKDILPFETRESSKETVKEIIDMINKKVGYIFVAAPTFKRTYFPKYCVYVYYFMSTIMCLNLYF